LRGKIQTGCTLIIPDDFREGKHERAGRGVELEVRAGALLFLRKTRKTGALE